MIEALKQAKAKWKKRDEELKAAAAAQRLSTAKPETASS
jgi:hypothetical protein